MPDSSSQDGQLLLRAAEGDDEAVNALLAGYRERLRRMVSSRLDTRLAARLDPSDIVQDTLLAAATGLPAYVRDQPMPFYPWLRRLALQRLVDLQRRHLGAQGRTVFREVPHLPVNDSTVHDLARHLLAEAPGPHSAAVAAEQDGRLRRALDALEETQREVLLLHYVENLSLAEAAEVLGITADAARMRHFRALRQLQVQLGLELGESRS